MFFICRQAEAQIILEPYVTGSAIERHGCGWVSSGHGYVCGSQSDSQTPEILVGFDNGENEIGSVWRTFFQGVVEFRLPPSSVLSAFEMTQNNFRARLRSLSVTVGNTVKGSVYEVNLYYLDDAYEDGIVTGQDHDAFKGDASIVTVKPEAGLFRFHEVDVTEELRHDIFGSGANTTTGFVLQSYIPVTSFNRGHPHIYISVNSDAGTDADTDTDTDTDTDADTDADTDTDADADNDDTGNDASADGGGNGGSDTEFFSDPSMDHGSSDCGCRQAGSHSYSNIIMSLIRLWTLLL